MDARMKRLYVAVLRAHSANTGSARCWTRSIRKWKPWPAPADDDRLVELLRVLDRVDLLGRDARIRPQPAQRVTRERDEREDQEARRHEHRDAVEESSKDVGQHRAVLAL